MELVNVAAQTPAPCPGVVKRGYSSMPMTSKPLQDLGERNHGYEPILLSKRLALWCYRGDNKLEIVYYGPTIGCQLLEQREKFGLKLQYKYQHDGVYKRCLEVSSYECDHVKVVEIQFFLLDAT